jgi:ketosteroid isomerase-like protein
MALAREDVTWARFLSRSEADDPLVRGKEELRAVWESQVEAVDLRLEAEEFIAAGDEKVIVPAVMVARGSGSEIALSAALTWVWTFDEGGLIARVDAFESRAAACRAAGLPE